MSSNEDFNALMSSEVFRIFASEMIKKEASKPKIDEAKVMEDFENIQNKINASPKLKHAFKHLQNKFMTDEEFTKKADPSFVQGVMLLDIEE